MSDLLIRNVSEGLKKDLQALAKASGRSLSEETKHILRKGLAVEKENRSPIDDDPYMQFRRTFADALLGDDEHQEMMDAIDAWREESRSPGPEDFE